MMPLEKQVTKSMRWKGIPGFKNYEVGDKGEIRSTRRSGAIGGLIKQHPVRGYLQAWLSENNIVRKISVHRAVAMAFLWSAYEIGHVVNHKDGNKFNNDVLNLEWCTRAENELHKKNVLGQDGKGEKNANYGYRHSKLYPSPSLRNRLCELGIPRYRHNLAELGEALPFVFNTHRCAEGFACYGHSEGARFPDKMFIDETEANSRAQMLIYLIEKGLVTP